MKPGLLYQNSPAFVAVVFLVLFSAAAAFGQTTGFTYQGRLTDGGTPANGNYDLQFGLWDSLSGGTQIGSTQTLNTILVSNGIFTVSLDFGANSFSGASRFLEIKARPTGGSFTLLTPRQPITSTPYAIRSLNATSADSVPVNGVPAGSGNYIQNASAPQTGNFNISGNGTAGGTLTGNVISASTQFNIGSDRVLSNAGSGNLFAGVSAGAANTTGFDNAFFGPRAGAANTTGHDNAFFGIAAGAANTLGSDNAFFGQTAGLSNTMGSRNNFFGTSAGLLNTTGSDNNFFGYNAGANNTNGGLNTFIGNDAGFNNTTDGSSNTFLGHEAGMLNSTGSGNTFVGVNAGTANTTGIRNTIIGAGATFGSANLSNSTAIGHNAEVDLSNSLVLGGIKGVNNGIDTNVGIGTSAPVFKLHVVDNSNTGLRVQTNIGGGTVASFGGSGDFQVDAVNVVGGRFIVQQGGNVGIGTASPDSKLTVNGTVDKPGGGSWGTFSDERLKNIKGRFTPGLNAVMQLQPLRYEYKRDNVLNIKSEGEHVGFSAQAVQKIIPEAVSKNDKGYLLINNDPILWTMLNAIKEQQEEIQDQQLTNEQQRARIKQQQAELSRQQQELDSLKKLVCRSHPRASVCK